MFLYFDKTGQTMKSDPMSNLRNSVTLKKTSTIEYKTCGLDWRKKWTEITPLEILSPLRKLKSLNYHLILTYSANRLILFPFFLSYKSSEGMNQLLQV